MENPPPNVSKLDSLIQTFKSPAALKFSTSLTNLVEKNLPKWGGSKHELTGRSLSFVNSITGKFEPFYPLKPVTTSIWNNDHAKNAMSLILAACLAYEDSDIVYSQLQHWGYTKIDVFGYDSPLLNYNTNGFVASNDEHVIVAFRGTETTKIIDWVTDMNCTFVDMASGKVATWPTYTFQSINGIYGLCHRGFYNALTGVVEIDDKMTVEPPCTSLFNILDSHCTNNKHIFLTGHSLGAALCPIFASLLAMQKGKDYVQKIAGIYNFGQPNIGDDNYIQSLHEVFPNKIYRIINDMDIVTRIPNDAMFFGYVEGPGLVQYFDTDGKFTPNLKVVPKGTVLGVIEGILPSWLTHPRQTFAKQTEISRMIRTLPNFIVDHFPMEYITKMKKSMESLYSSK